LGSFAGGKVTVVVETVVDEGVSGGQLHTRLGQGLFNPILRPAGGDMLFVRSAPERQRW
jgi:hypothetical protein